MCSPSNKKQRTMSSSPPSESEVLEQQLQQPPQEEVQQLQEEPVFVEQQIQQDEVPEHVVEVQQEEEHVFVEQQMQQGEENVIQYQALDAVDVDLGCYEEDLQQEIFLSPQHHVLHGQGFALAGLDFGYHGEENELFLPPQHHVLHGQDLAPVEMVPDNVPGPDEVLHYTNLRLSKQLITHPITIIDANTRATTIDAMISSEKARRYPNAIHLAVLAFDQYFASLSENQQQAALNPDTVITVALNPDTVITVALFLAVKYEYGIERTLRLEFNIRDLEVELQILRTFNFKLSSPTTKTFLDLALTLSKPQDANFGFLCSYISELSLLDRECAVFHPSLLAVACVFLAEFVLHPHQRPTKVITSTPWYYSTHRLRDAVNTLHEILSSRRHPLCTAIRNKYFSFQFGGVASLPCGYHIPEEYYPA